MRGQGRIFFNGEYYAMMYVYITDPIRKEKMIMQESSGRLKGKGSSASRWSWPKLGERTFISVNATRENIRCFIFIQVSRFDRRKM